MPLSDLAIHTTPERMRYLLRCLHRGQAPEGGIAFPNVWQTLNLDYTPASLQRLSRLLNQIHSRRTVSYYALQNSEAGRNFLLTLAAYLGEYVGRFCGTAPEWRDDGRVVLGTAFNPLEHIRNLIQGTAGQPEISLENTLWLTFHFAADADCEKMGEFFLDCHARKLPLPHGTAFAEELQQIELDGSERSLHDIDALFARLRQTLPLTPGNVEKSFQSLARRNFLILIAYYVGRTVSRLSGKPALWLNRPQTAAATGRDDLDPFYDSMGCETGGEITPMLRFVTLSLGSGNPSCAQWLHRLRHSEAADTDTVDAAPRRDDTDPNRTARILIDGFLRGNTPPDGEPMPPLAYETELRTLRPDYSLRSLEQLDKLLLRLRGEGFQPEDFTQDPARRNFLHFCAFYLARTTAVLSGSTLKFLTYQEARQQVSGLSEGWYSLYAARIGDRLYFPLGRLFGLLFEDEPADSLTVFARKICHSQPGLLHIRNPLAADGGGTVLDAWRKPLLETGCAASWSLWDKSEQPGLLLTPTIVRPNAQGRSDMIKLLPDASSPVKGISFGKQVLDENPTDAAYLALIYEGYANLPHGRFDAVLVELRVYDTQHPLNIEICLPFQPALPRRPFAIGSIAVNGRLPDRKTAESIADAFYRGLDDFHMPGRGKRWWRGHYRQAL